MAEQTVSQHSAQSLPASTIEAARVKRCRIHFCTPMTSALDECEWWMVQQGSCMKFLASLPEVVKYVEELAPMKPLVFESAWRNIENAGRSELQGADHA